MYETTKNYCNTIHTVKTRFFQPIIEQQTDLKYEIQKTKTKNKV